MKYVLYEDFWTRKHCIGYRYSLMNANTDLKAIEEAEKIYNQENHYLIRIMKKTGKVEKLEDGWKRQRYEAIMCKRNNEVGWHENTEQNSEGSHTAYRYYKKDLEYYTAI